MNLKCIIFILGIFLLSVSYATEYTTELKSHLSNNYDITVVYNLQKNINDSISCTRPDELIGRINNSECYNVKILARTNAIGMPLELNGRVLTSQKNDLEFVVDLNYPKKYFTQNHLIEYSSSIWTINSEYYSYYSRLVKTRAKYSYYDYDSYYETKYVDDVKPHEAPGGMLNFNSYQDYSYPFDITWTPKKTTKGCVSLTYLADSHYYKDVYFKIFQKGHDISIVSHRLEPTNSLKTLILRTDDYFFKNKTYNLIISGYYLSFGIKRIAQCSDVEDVYELSASDISVPLPTINIYHIDDLTSSGSEFEHKECKSNEYGLDCLGTCSTHKTFCQRMLFCTTQNGCSCASGYTGQYCDQYCPLGTYGRDCKKKCQENCDSCNIYTGACIGGCKKNFILPNCTEKYPWLINPPKLISTDYHSVKLHISLASENIDGSTQKTPLFYQIVYKQALSNQSVQYSDIKEVGNIGYAVDEIDGLKTETEYSFGTIIITDDGNYNDEDINTVNYTTSCLIPEVDYGVNISKGADYINVTWNKYNTSEYECKIIDYAVKLIFNEKDDLYEVVNSSAQYEHVFDHLIPGHTYAVQVTAMTTLGPTEPSKIQYGTPDLHGFIGIQNVTAIQNDLDKTVIHLAWEMEDKYIDAPISYMVKYKINHQYSCSRDIINSTWTNVVVNNKTKYDITNVISNAQYIIQVQPVTDYTYANNENAIFVQTASSTPELAPVLDNSGQPIYVTNKTAQFKWFVNNTYCSKFNGFLTGFHLVLKNLKDMSQVVQETVNNTVEFTNLIPNTEYELQVFITSKKGFNTDYVLSVPFKTKTKFLPAVEGLLVYKKNLNTRTVGIRWSYPSNVNANGFIISVNSTSKSINITQLTIEPTKCKAWPNLYCATIEKLLPSILHTIQVKAKSIDYPSGGLPATIDISNIEGAPDEPTNLKTTYIGAKDITLEWDIPWMLNGVLDSFIINVEEIFAVDVNSCCTSSTIIELPVTEEKPTYNYTINDLIPGSTYIIGVSLKTSWYGQAKQIYVTTLLDTTSNLTS